MKRTCCFCIITALLVLLSACQETVEMGSVYGVVTNSKTGEPVKGASVTLSPSNLTTVTGYDGHYEFVEVEAGQYKVFSQANGYEPNYQTITVKAGQSSIADIMLTPETVNSNFQLSTTLLDFGSTYSELALTITNTGTAGDLSWSVGDVSVDWLHISPQAGTIAMGKSDVTIATIDRTKITEDSMTTLRLTAAGDTKSIVVKVSKGEGGNGSTNGGEDDIQTEDYSSATISIPMSDVVGEIVSCKRSGKLVTLTYMLTNSSGSDVMMELHHGTKTSITDDAANAYSGYRFTLGSKSGIFAGSLFGAYVYSGTPAKGTIEVNEVNADAKTMSFIIDVTYQQHGGQYYDLMKFLNVPIY